MVSCFIFILVRLWLRMRMKINAQGKLFILLGNSILQILHIS